MDLFSYAKALKKGACHALVTERPAKTLKRKFDAEANTLTKRMTTVVKVGCEYDNFTAVKEARKDGRLPSENAGLKWGSWTNPISGESEYPYVIHHTNKGGDYKRYLRVYVNLGQTKSEWFLNGKKVNKADIAEFLSSAETSDKDDIVIFPMPAEESTIVRLAEWNADADLMASVEAEFNAYFASTEEA